ncbi:MAG TPA: trypsin-like serine protease [Gaiellaceae bacterium]|nr:trypsin-like serine protease [Gaiellaceae bacterium]
MKKNISGRRLAWLTAVAVIALGTLAASALAVVNGSPDNGRHPYVGVAVWFPTGNPSGGFELCSGSLVSPTVFVTAAHCFPEGAVVLVDTAEAGLADLHQPGFGQAVPGIAHPDRNWQTGAHGLSGSDLNDVAVVKLFGPIDEPRYAQLPTQGYDDTLPNNQGVDIVGYGIQTQTPLTFGSRFDAPAKIIPGGGASGSEFLKISSSPGQGGATCNGDSGGPDLQANTDLMLAISSYGPSATCKAVAYSQRMDTTEALGFVQSFLSH